MKIFEEDLKRMYESSKDLTQELSELLSYGLPQDIEDRKIGYIERIINELVIVLRKSQKS